MNTIAVPSPVAFDAAGFAAQALSSPTALAALFDHTLLKPEATRAQIIHLCHETAQHRFACAMVNPCWVPTAVEVLAGTGVPVGVVIGFPLGASLSSSKRDEATRLMKLGAHEVDMVLNIGLLKSASAGGSHSKSDYEALKQDIRCVAEVVHQNGGILKVILETCLLTFEEKLRSSEIAQVAGADFIQTSTGFSSGGATVDDITLMRSVAGTRAGVKASGGIRTLIDATAMLHAGATRIGASASVKIVAELAARHEQHTSSPAGQ